jgi:hypothetical protein
MGYFMKGLSSVKTFLYVCSFKANFFVYFPEESFLLQPCPLPIITKMMADSVAKNFQVLYEYVLEPKGHFSDTINEMIRKFSRDAYSVSCNLLAGLMIGINTVMVREVLGHSLNVTD